MVDDRDRGGSDRFGQDYGRDYGSARDNSLVGARDYGSAGEDRGDDDRRPYGQRDYGNQRYGERDRMNRGQSFSASGGGFGGYAGGGMGGRDRDDERDTGYYQGGSSYRSGGSTGDGRRFPEMGRDRDHDSNRGYGGRGDDDDRGFFERAGDEVRSWFGDDDAQRRRGRDDQGGRRVSADWDGDRVHDHRDRDYHQWRQSQIAELDRDYEEYRNENRSKFHNEFSTWRSGRQTQRQMLNQIEEHAEVLGSDGEHVGTVDKVRGDRIILTKSDADAGGRHHSIPSNWLESVEGGKIKLSKSSVEAKTMWRDEEGQGAIFGKGDDDAKPSATDEKTEARDNQGRMLNRSFSGTY